MDTDTARTVLYARISQDDAGTEKGVGRQLEDCRRLAELRGFEVVAEYVENDVSAFAHRPEYERMMADVAKGTTDVIVVYSTSRLWRNRTQRGAAIDTLGKLGVRIEAVSGPSLDLASATGRYLADVIAGGDTRESEEKGERVARASRQRAEEGRANGVCPYGWRREYEHDERGKVTGFRDVEDPDAAAVVREIVTRIADGDGLRTIAADLERRGVPVPSGRDGVSWRHSTVRKLAIRPGNIGKRVHRGKIIGPAAWPAIVDVETFDRAVMVLDQKAKQPPGAQFPAQERRWLLTYGVGECGVCTGPLRVATKRQKRKTGPVEYRLYVCDETGCTGRSVDKVDELVGAVVVARLSKPDAVSALTAPREGDAEDAARLVTELTARLDAAADQYAEGTITASQMARITSKLQPRIEAAERDARRASLTPEPVAELADLAGAGERAQELWNALAVERQRAVLEVLGVRVRILPTKQGPGFVPEHVEIAWKVAS